MKMPYGAHKGEEIEDVPTSYLNWLDKNYSEEWIGTEVRKELARRAEFASGKTSVSKTTKLPRDVIGGKIIDLLRQCPDDVFDKDWILGEFKVRFKKK